jgi:hypothetical protein
MRARIREGPLTTASGIVKHFGQPRLAGAHPPIHTVCLSGKRKRRVEPEDTGNVRRSGAQGALLAAADLSAGKLYAALYHERADAFRRVKFMRADAVEIDRKARKRQLTEGLHTV